MGRRTRVIFGLGSLVVGLLVTLAGYHRAHKQDEATMDRLSRLTTELEMRTAAERALESQLDLHRAALDHRGIVVEWNEPMEKLTGYTASEMIGTDLSRLMPPEMFRHHDEQYRATLADKSNAGKTFRIACELLRKDRAKKPIAVEINTTIVGTDPPSGIARVFVKSKIVEVKP